MSHTSTPRARYGVNDDGTPYILSNGHAITADELQDQIASLDHHLASGIPSGLRLAIRKRRSALERILDELTRMAAQIAPTPAEVAETLLARMSPDEALTRINRIAWHNAGGNWQKTEWTHQLNEVGRLILIADAAQAQAQEEQAA